jgi:tripartite-type tricarboxylate transporter receptor subunit TctC
VIEIDTRIRATLHGASRTPQGKALMLNRRQLVQMSAASTLASALGGRGAAAQATSPQAWPTRFVKLVVPFTPGGGIDGIGRIVGARLSEMWGQQVVVENKPGAGGNIASEFVARSAPDGYTMYITAGGLAVNRYLFQSINYDPVADFAPVTLICLFPNLLVVPNSSPLRSVGDLLAEARKNPGKVTFASPGHGSSPHMSGELFKYMAKVDLTHVPYRGASPAYTDVIAGRVDCTFAVMASGLPLVQAGQLRALGVTTGARVAAAPDIPTIAEAGVPGYDTSSWFAFFVPAKTPDDIVRKMHADTVAVLREPPIKAKLDQLGVIIVGSTPDDLGTHLRAEMEKWGPVIKTANIKVNE